MKPVRKKPTLPELVLERMRAAIDENEFREVLPPERELCSTIGVSRPTLPLALDQLKLEGWIEVAGRRTRIRRPRRRVRTVKVKDQLHPHQPQV